MELILSLAGVLGALLIGAVTPGPSFIVVARTSMAVSRTDAIFAALGMGVGGVMFCIVVLAGFKVALVSVPWLWFVLKFVGGVYLVYIALRIWRGAKMPLVIPTVAERVNRTLGRSFLLGLFTQLSNPKTAVIYGGIFAALLPRDLPPSATVALPFLVFLIETGWYALVAYALSSPRSQSAYLRSKVHLDRIAGGVMGFLGIKLIIAARPASF